MTASESHHFFACFFRSFSSNILFSTEKIQELEELIAEKQNNIEMLTDSVEQLTSLVDSLEKEIDATVKAKEEFQVEMTGKIEMLEAEAAQVKEEDALKIEKLEQNVASIVSGRGRLVQLQELQEAREKDKEEFEEQERQLQQQIEALTEENEILIQSNEQMASVLEQATGGTGADRESQISHALESAEASEQVRLLEQTTQRQLEVIELQEEEKDAIQKALDEQKERGDKLDNIIEDLEVERSSLQTTKAELQLSLASYKEELNETKKQRKQEKEESDAKIEDLEKKLQDTTNERDDLIALRDELKGNVEKLEQEKEEELKSHQKHTEQIEVKLSSSIHVSTECIKQ